MSENLTEKQIREIFEEMAKDIVVNRMQLKNEDGSPDYHTVGVMANRFKKRRKWADKLITTFVMGSLGIFITTIASYVPALFRSIVKLIREGG